MNIPSKGFGLLLLSLLLILNACINLKQPRSKIDFYTLEYSPPKTSGLQALPAIIMVDRFSVAPEYNSNRIIYREKSHKRGAYVNHRWRVSPGAMIGDFLRRDFQRAGLFAAVLPYDSGISPSHRVEGTVEEFYENETEGQWEALLTLSVTLLKEGEPDIVKRIVYQKIYGTKEICGEKSPQALALAMSRAMEMISGQIIKDTYDSLRNLK